MSPKRTFSTEDEIEHRSIVPKTKRCCCFSNAAGRKLVMDDMLIDRLIAKLEPAVRRWVSEAVERVIINHVHPSPTLRISPAPDMISPAPDMICRLRFQEPIFKSKTIYIGNKISVPVSVVNADSDAIVTSDLLSSISVELVVLDGHFEGNEQNKWTEDEFNQAVVTRRVGKEPLLTGKTVVKLINGAGVLNVCFKDNSCWTKTKMFRLGLRAFPGQKIHGRVLEAISEAFPVRDNRGEPCQKYHPPLYSDEVFRLEKIWRKGVYHKKLEDMGITTVQEFVFQLKKDELQLRRELGMTKKIWEATFNHASESVPGCELYSYSDAVSKVDILFDSDRHFVGANLEGKYIPCNHLNLSQQDKVSNLWKFATENPNEVQLFRRTVGSNIPRPPATVTGGPDTGLSVLQPENPNSSAYYHGLFIFYILIFESILLDIDPNKQVLQGAGSCEVTPQPQPYSVQIGLMGDSYTVNFEPSPEPYQRNERWSPFGFEDNFDLDVLLNNFVQIKKRKWVRLSSFFKCKSVFSRMLADKRAGIVHLTLQEGVI